MIETLVILTILYCTAMIWVMSAKDDDVFLISVLFCVMTAFPLIQLLGKI